MAFGLDLGNLLVHLRCDESQLLRSLDTAEKRLRATADKLTAVGRKMTMRVTAPIVAMGAMATKSFSSFDDAMTKSLAIMGDVTPSMEKKMKRVALSLSKEGVTSATSLAKAYFYLASAGLTAEQSIEALSAVNEFAIAGSFDLSQAVEMAAGSQKALGLSSKNAETNLKNLTRVTDVLVGANLLAQATTSQFAEALGTESAAAMKQWGIEVEEGVAVLAAYAAQMEKGAAAGSAFSRFLRLSMQAYRKNSEVWKKMGVDLYDANRNLRPLADIVEDLTKLLRPLSTEAKGATIEILGFQARSMQVLLPLLGMSDAIRGFHKRLKEMSGFTKTTAQKNMESFAAAMKITWNWVVSLGIGIGRQLAPLVLKLGDYVRKSVAFWDSLNESVQKNVLLYAAVAAAIGPVLLATGFLLKSLAFMIVTVKSLTKVFFLLGAAISAPIAVVLALAAIAYVLRAAWLQNIGAIKDRMQEWFDAFKQGFDWLKDDVIGQFVKYLYDSFVEVFRKIRTGYKDFVADLTGLTAGVWAFLKETGFKRGAEAFAKAYVDAFDKVQGKMIKFEELTVKTFKITPLVLEALGEATVEHLEELMENVKTQFNKDTDAIISLIKSKIEKLQKEVPTVAGVVPTLPVEDVKELTNALKKLQTTGTEALSENAQLIEQMLRELDTELSLLGKINEERERAVRLEKFRSKVMEEHGNDLETINKLMSEYAEKLDKLMSGRRGFSAFTVQLRQWASDATNIWEGFGEVATRAFDDAASSLSRMLMRGKVDFKAFMRAIIGDLITIMIRAQMTQAAMSLFPSLFATPAPASSGMTTGQQMNAMAEPGYYQHGGEVEKTGWAYVHKGEEFSGVGKKFSDEPSKIDVHIHNEGAKQEITKAQEYLVSNQRIIDVWIQAVKSGGETARAVKQVR